MNKMCGKGFGPFEQHYKVKFSEWANSIVGSWNSDCYYEETEEQVVHCAVCAREIDGNNHATLKVTVKYQGPKSGRQETRRWNLTLCPSCGPQMNSAVATAIYNDPRPCCVEPKGK